MSTSSSPRKNFFPLTVFAIFAFCVTLLSAKRGVVELAPPPKVLNLTDLPKDDLFNSTSITKSLDGDVVVNLKPDNITQSVSTSNETIHPGAILTEKMSEHSIPESNTIESNVSIKAVLGVTKRDGNGELSSAEFLNSSSAASLSSTNVTETLMPILSYGEDLSSSSSLPEIATVGLVADGQGGLLIDEDESFTVATNAEVVISVDPTTGLAATVLPTVDTIMPLIGNKTELSGSQMKGDSDTSASSCNRVMIAKYVLAMVVLFVSIQCY